MFEGVFSLLRNVKILAEACVLLGVGLLIYYWSVTISFFPPALSLGDVAKLLVVATVGAFTFSVMTLYTVCFGAVPLILVLYASLRFVKSFGWRRDSMKAIQTIRKSDLLAMAVAGSFFLPFYLLMDIVTLSPTIILGVLVAAFSFLFIVYSEMERSSPPWKETGDEREDRLKGSKITILIGVFLGVTSALIIWGGPNAFLFATMKQAGVMSLNQNAFIKEEYCPLLGSTFDTESSEGYCYVEGADILFQGMGERMLLAKLADGYRVSLPSAAVFVVDGFSSVDTSWTPETTKPAQGGLSH